jgi:hypothetical protein
VIDTCGAVDCANSCDGDYAHGVCPNITPKPLVVTEYDGSRWVQEDDFLVLKERCNKFIWQVRDTCSRAEAAEAQVARLTEALKEARELVESWAGYAPDYFREKHDLDGDLARLDAAIKRNPGPPASDGEAG